MMGCKSMGGGDNGAYQNPSEHKAVYGGNYILTLDKQPVDQSKLNFQMCSITKYWPGDSSSPKDCVPAFVDSNFDAVSLTIDELGSIALTADELEVLRRFEVELEDRLDEIDRSRLSSVYEHLVPLSVDPQALVSVWGLVYFGGFVASLPDYAAFGKVRPLVLVAKLHAVVFGIGMGAKGIMEVDKVLKIHDAQKVQLLKEADDKPVSASYKELGVLEWQWEALTTTDPEFARYVNNIFEITNSLGVFLKQRLRGLPAGRMTHYCFPIADQKRECKILKSL